MTPSKRTPSMPILSGFEWWSYPRGWRDVIRCMRGRHTAVMNGVMDSARGGRVFVQRCSCGATALDLDPWIPERGGARKRRKGSPVPAGARLRELRESLPYPLSEGLDDLH